MLALAAESDKDLYLPVDAYVIPAKDDMRDEAFRIVAQLRAAGIRADVDLMRRTMSKNLKYAASIGARFAVIVGRKEMEKSSVTLRDMASGDQRLTPIEDLAKAISG
jgi:histidyl-tRNA synthetase